MAKQNYAMPFGRYLCGVVASAAMLLVGTVGAQATHIDQLGINITVFSSDGAGNFVLRYDEYFGSDSTTIWNGSQWGLPSFTTGACSSAADCFYNTSITINIDTSSLSGSTSVAATFQGLVDSSGAHTGAFGTGQFFTNNVNGPSDASLWSDFLAFSIVGFDPNTAYTVSGSANDCCYVAGSSGPSFDGTFQFDPRVIVTGETPLPAALPLFASGLGALGVLGWRRKRKAKSAA